MKIRIAVCDDNSIFVSRVKKICEEYFVVKDENCMIECFSGGEELLQASDLSWDILFLDIEMGETSGIDVKNRLLEKNSRTQIVFLTSHSECMKQAFGRNVIGFIEKQDLGNELPDMLRRLYIDMLRKTEVWEVMGNAIVLDDIYYIRAEGNYVNIMTRQGDFLFRKSLKECEQELRNRDFMKVHRSTLIHLKYVTGVTESTIEIAEKYKLKISRGMCRKIKQEYMDYIRKRG